MHSIRHLEMIQTLARYQHFGRAAMALGISQPALTRSLKHLEGLLGVRLFDREGAVAPTLFGQIVLTRGSAVLGDFADMMREIALAKGLDVGRLDIAAGPYPADISAQRAVGLLSERHPTLLIRFNIKNWTEVADDIVTGRSDVGLAEISEASNNPELETEPVRSSMLRFFCNAKHPLTRQKKLTIEHLQDFPWVGPSAPGRMREFMPNVDKPFGVFNAVHDRFTPRILVETLAVAKQIVTAGHGLAVALPSQIAGEVKSRTLAILPIELPWMRLNYGFISKRARTKSPSTLAFMDIVRKIESAIPN